MKVFLLTIIYLSRSLNKEKEREIAGREKRVEKLNILKI